MNKSGLFSSIKHDFPASIVVFLVALPLCLGVALASGAPLFSGLIAGMVGGIVVASFSGSQLSVSGPAAGLTAIVLSAITQLSTYETFLFAVVLAGVLQLIFGLLKAGTVSNYIPSNVIKGMLAAIGIILILKQIPHAFGYDATAEGLFAFAQPDQHNTFTELYFMLNKIHPGAVIIALISVAILLIWERPFFKKFRLFPAPLAVVAVGVLLNQIFLSSGSPLGIQPSHLVSIPVSDGLGGFFSNFKTPDFSAFANPQVYVVAVTLAIVASIESLLSLEASDKMDPERRYSSTNQELKAQGIGNIVSGLIGGLPVTSVIVRSSANIQSGAKTKLSAIMHGVLLLLSALLIPGLLNMIPLAALAAILIMTGYKLAKVSIFKEMFKNGWGQFLPFVITIAAIVFTDLLIGIAIGIVVSTLSILNKNLRNSYFFKKEQYHDGEVIRVELSEEVSFLNKASLMLTLENLPHNSKVILDATRSVYIDFDVIEVIKEFKNVKAPERNIQLNLLGFKNNYKDYNNVSFMSAPTKESQSQLKPSQVLQILKDGNNRFVHNHRLDRNHSHLVHTTASGQFPHAVVLSCIDSRTSSEVIFDQSIGDIFSVRIAGNVSNEDILGSMEFGCKVAGSKLIVVLGHTNCGAIKGACDHVQLGNLTGLLSKVKPALDAEVVTLENRTSKNTDFVNNVTRLNVFTTMKNIRESSPILNEMINSGEIALVGAMYDVETGKVTFYEKSLVESKFTPVQILQD
ncbi:bifunctional SulP family inorganic anion transporter/carbonic anhydrase [Solitalea canadensis]|uniref:Sulfate permease-like transporter, MFS superfamily n=1 Tax=Solitalea canadensis (strain ATCC 29591 / DSM 3403 / JCM 21819 / LMG 8368 / NBRC 15130 / NCIMB 12057 / USAM 9D) TaxID=929556 RepID=H8KQR7_SOLCM|nr:bifunctional SulP family inorganic anion transporter/carbonic anhydrase [Solitalea canadensis]AFD06938.1 sulfate permease-like transporter, MFS superfamily [Solitalea canadensis DSM 3403]